MTKILLGILLSFIVAYGAYRKESLSRSGLISALLTGTFIYYFGGLFFWSILIAFFISSSLISKFGQGKKQDFKDINDRDGKRDYVQVVANGSAAVFFSYMYSLGENPIYMIALASVFAASNADTWGSELGVLSRRKPISIITFKETEKGISGAISIFGTAASLMGAIFIAIIFSTGYIIGNNFPDPLFKYFIIITLSGFLGSIIDSYLGALIQVKYKCSVCSKITERKIHHGKTAIKVKGIAWFNNDVVNFTSGVMSALVAMMLFVNL